MGRWKRKGEWLTKCLNMPVLIVSEKPSQKLVSHASPGLGRVFCFGFGQKEQKHEAY
jgi:hypothetical protein